MTKQRETRERVLELIEPLSVGDAIPSERQLGIDLGVSRLTVRAALDDLVREGLPRPPPRSGHVRRRAEGREGDRHLVVHRRHAGPRAYAGSRTLDLRPSSPARGSGASSTSRRVSRSSSVKRLRLADGEPMAVELLHMRASLVPGLTARDLEENSFYDLLANRYGISIVGGTQTVEPTVTNEEESASLGVPLHSPALLFERVTRSSTGELVEFTSSTYRGDRYRLVSELGIGGSSPMAIAPAAALR